MLTALAPDLWIQRLPYSVMGLALGRQLVVIRLPSGELWITSPIPPTPALVEELAGLGTVAHVVAPNRYHDECLAAWQGVYPGAVYHAAPGLARTCRDVRFDATLGDPSARPVWADALDQHLVAGMPRLMETVFLHRDSGTLILTDLCFNLRPPLPLFTRLAMRCNDAYDRFGPTRMCRGMIRDRSALRTSLQRVLAWDFDRIIVGHGQNIEHGGPAALREAFAYLPL